MIYLYPCLSINFSSNLPVRTFVPVLLRLGSLEHRRRMGQRHGGTVSHVFFTCSAPLFLPFFAFLGFPHSFLLNRPGGVLTVRDILFELV